MDPLSIAASFVQLAVVCIQVTTGLYTYAEGHSNVDSHDKSLCDDV